MCHQQGHSRQRSAEGNLEVTGTDRGTWRVKDKQMERDSQTARHRQKTNPRDRKTKTNTQKQKERHGAEGRVDGPREEESGKLRLRLRHPRTLRVLFWLVKRLTGWGLHWDHFLHGPPFSLQAKWLGFSGLQTPTSPLCFSLAPGSLDWMPAPSSPIPQHLGQERACRCCSLGLPPSRSSHSGSQGPGDNK